MRTTHITSATIHIGNTELPVKDCTIESQMEMDRSVINELRRAWQEWRQQQTATITIIPTVQYDEQGPFVDGTLEVIQ